MANVQSDSWKIQCFRYGKQQQWTYSTLHNTVIIIIQMASSAQEPVIYC